MRVLVAWMNVRLPHRTKFRVFTGKAYNQKEVWMDQQVLEQVLRDLAAVNAYL
jgi:hypothetical protein